MDEQQQVTEDVSRVQRLVDLKNAGVLTPEEAAFVEAIEQHRVGSAIVSEVVAGAAPRPEASSQHLTLDDAQRARADAILAAHGG
jgi:hypothetical protein